MTVAQALHRMTVDEYVRIVRDFGWESTELVEGVVYDVASEYNRHAWTVMTVLDALRYRDPEGASYRTIDRFDVGEDARDLDVTAILTR